MPEPSEDVRHSSMSSEHIAGGSSSASPVNTETISREMPPSLLREMPSAYSIRHCAESTWIFEDLPKATIVSVSRADNSDVSSMVLSYIIECQYKQFKWNLLKKASHVLFLHFALKKRSIIEDFHEKQEQVKEWLQNLGIGDQTAFAQDDGDEGGAKNRKVPSIAALPIIRPTLGAQHSISDRAKVAMQGYLNHFLGNMHIANSREVCKFLEVSRLSFLEEYGPKLKEDYVMARHLSRIPGDDSERKCWACHWFCCCSSTWQKVWAVLKPGFLALLEDPFDTKILDVIIFDVLPTSDRNGDDGVYLAKESKERNPLRYAFKVSCGNRSIKLRTINTAKVKEWVAAINDVGLKPPEGWCHPHRFGSFAPPRGLNEDGSRAQWFVDGQAAFEMIASAIESAKSEVFLTGWWVCPELYLRRPFHSNGSSRLDALLEAKAKQGVKIYILLYKEVAIALKINSLYSKKRLQKVHENVKVVRYPDHFSTGVYLWSHHEKLVIVDYRICFIGGLDLCFGRYDNMEHKVGDFPPLTWPGKDYYNPRESEPNSWEDLMKDELERDKYPRMPWHDVHCALWGPPCRDVARHFVQRWNFAKRNKAPNERRIPLLMPHHQIFIPQYMIRSRDIDSESTNAEENQKDTNSQDSFSLQSPFSDIPLLRSQKSDVLDSSVDDQKLTGLHINHNFLNQPSRVCRSFSLSNQKSKLVSDMQMNAFADDIDSMDRQSESNLDLLTRSGTKILDGWWETQEQGYKVVSADETGQVGPPSTCRCQVIRSVSQWSAGTCQTEESIHTAYCSLIEKSEHFIYIENQFFISGLTGDEVIQNRVLEALYRRILQAHEEQKCFRVIVVMPLLPGFTGGLDDGGAATVRAVMHWQYRTICRGRHSILHKLNGLIGPKAHDYISFYGLRSYGRLFDGGPVATSQIYVHSKMMIVDDRSAVIGSSNINDRSLLGSRDSEIGVLIEDTDFIESSMNGEPWKAGKFAHSLRVSLWSEHLGLQAGEVSQISDPIADTTFKDIWLETAKSNAIVYQDVFACIPNDHIRSRSSLRHSMARMKEKVEHNTVDLGVAPQRLESSSQNGEVEETDPMQRLDAVRGHLVCFPLEFMCQENLRPVFNESEFYASPQVFQ